MSPTTTTTTPDLSTVASARAALVAALRSGEYVQGAGALKAIGGVYCCLGVAGDLCVQAGTAAWSGTHLIMLHTKRDDWPVANARGYLYELWEGASNPFGFTIDEQHGLAGANDRHVPFSAIADLIEAAGTDPLQVTEAWVNEHAAVTVGPVRGV